VGTSFKGYVLLSLELA